MSQRARSIRHLLALGEFERKLLEKLSASPEGLSRGQLGELFPEGDVVQVAEDLVANFQAQRFEGVIYAITELGRSRLSPKAPECVETVS